MYSLLRAIKIDLLTLPDELCLNLILNAKISDLIDSSTDLIDSSTDLIDSITRIYWNWNKK